MVWFSLFVQFFRFLSIQRDGFYSGSERHFGQFILLNST